MFGEKYKYFKKVERKIKQINKQTAPEPVEVQQEVSTLFRSQTPVNYRVSERPRLTETSEQPI